MAIRLRELRKEKGLTQAELAQVVHTNQSQYGKYENSKTKLSLDNAKILADFFGVSIPYGALSSYNQGIRTPKKENAIKLANYFGVSIPYLLGLDDTPTLVNSRGTIPANWMQELFSISHKKSELLQEYMELDKREKAILKQIMENSNAT